MAKSENSFPPSVKLTVADRDGIVRRALDHAFKKDDAAIAKRESVLARRCYNSLYSASLRKMVEALPEGWTGFTSKPGFNIGGLHIDLRIEEGLRVPLNASYSRLGVVKDRAIIEAVNELLADKTALAERRKKARAATEAIVESCTSTKQLREVWPQGESFYKQIEPIVRASLPVAQIKQLNEMLGLKKAA